MLVSGKVGALVYCNSQEQVKLMQKLQLLKYFQMEVTYVLDGLNVENHKPPEGAKTVSAYNMNSPELVELWWQLPNLSEYDQTLFIDMNWISFITPELLNSLVDTDQGVVQSATAPTAISVANNILALNPYVMVFDKTPQTLSFFSMIRVIARNWERFSVARLVAQHRDKTLEMILAIATELIFGTNVDRLSPAYPTTQLQILPNSMFQNGAQIKPTYLQNDLLRRS